MSMTISEKGLEYIKDFTEEEREVFYNLLRSATSGDTLDLSPVEQLYNVDYHEIPVSIDQFISDPRYMGSVYNNGENIYPFWKDYMHRVFHNNPYGAFEQLLSGAIGTGKTTIASLMMTYMIYRTLCLKDPQKFYELTSNSPIVFVVLNLTLDLAYEGMYSLIVESIKMSPWFKEHVDIRGKYNYVIDFPNNLQLMVGSNTQHTIGKNVLCITGDTIVATDRGDYRIDSLEGQMVTMISRCDDKGCDYSVPALVQKTGYYNRLIKITLTDSTEIRCTLDHLWRLDNGEYREAQDLEIDDILDSNLSDRIKVVSKEIIEYEYDVPVYDVINAYPHNNFLVKTKRGYIVSHNCAIMDEVNFSRAPKDSKNSIMSMYRNIRRRMESRFMKAGRQPGLLMMISSKNTELDFLEQYIHSVKHLTTTWVVDKPVYDIKPADTYLGPKFKVAVGDKTKSSIICTSDEDAISKADAGYSIIEVPIEYRQAFETDINEALKEIAGISHFTTNKLIPYAGKLDDCIIRTRGNPVDVETIYLGLDSIDDIRDYITDMASLRRLQHLPRFAHADLALKGDSLGFSVVHIPNQTEVTRYNQAGAIVSVQENIYETDLSIRIRTTPGSEIPLYKLREFIIWLHSALWKFHLVTYDGFQSADSIQLLNTAGVNAKLLSVDRTADPYLNLRSAILEKRLRMYDHPILSRELYELEYDSKNKKVDHPIISYNNQPGSKDMSDSLAGSVWNAQQYSTQIRGQQVRSTENLRRSTDHLSRLKIMNTPVDEYDDSWV